MSSALASLCPLLKINLAIWMTPIIIGLLLLHNQQSFWKCDSVADLRGGGRNRRTPPPLNVSQTAVKMVYKQFAGSSRIKNWINDNQQLLFNSLINKTIHVSQSARLYWYIIIRHCIITFCVSRWRRRMYCGHARLSVCLSAAICPHYCMDPDVTWGMGSGRGCPLVVYYWADLQSVHWLHC